MISLLWREIRRMGSRLNLGIEAETAMIIETSENEFEGFDEDGPYVKVKIDMIPPWASFHSEHIRWNHKVARSMIEDWKKIKSICKSRGVKELIATNANVNDKRWPKYIRLFGFKEPTLVSVSKQEI